MDRNTADYLAALVRTEIRKHQKDIDGFRPRTGQSAGEAAVVLAEFTTKQEFRTRVLDELRGLS